MDTSRIISMVSTKYKTDSIGQSVPVTSERSCMCRVSSVSASEFFEAGRSGIEAQLRVEMFAWDYAGEKTVSVDGVRYGVYRTYQPNPDRIELYLEPKAGA